MKHPIGLMAIAAAAAATSQAAVVFYDFTGITNVGGQTRTFTGVFEYDAGVASSTVYFPGQSAPVQQGFQSTFVGAIRGLSISLDNGESVHGGIGYIHNNNIQQAEPGAQVPPGQSLQAYSSGVSGTINGLQITGLYLAFLPVTPNFSWDALDEYFNGNAEALLQANPSLLPGSIDPALTGTALPADLLTVFTGGLFLGTFHGNTTTVNSIMSFTLRGPAGCYANCDQSTIAPILNVNDFSCFLNRYAAGSSMANCDGSTIAPILNVNDFTCFLNRYAAGCP